MQQVRFSIVSYLNTLPFLYGIQNSPYLKDNMVMDLDIPSVCAQKLNDGTVDAGLVPVALLPHLKEYHIIADYCIGAVGNVKSVLLLSEVPLEEIETIMLDYQSRTSVNLVQVLAKEYWNISPNFVQATEGYEETIQGKTAAVVIGDRTFALLDKYKYTYDLAGEWQKFKNLPFVFAVWAANKPISTEFIAEFNKTLKFGLEHKAEAAKLGTGRGVDESVILDYFENSISYEFDAAKKVGLHKFLKYLKRG
ncbi:MAG: menaquinone biosynthesis protein [Sphingobacteriales bacterium JAD_PAG50586_3]|nr:MAG: menaquinone biosynthesis protein [Sphingobacteriales bacterium JAD_PAG50586_3]